MVYATNDTEDELVSQTVIPPSLVQCVTYIIFEIPSLTCTIFLLFHLLSNRNLRKALHNHIIIILLILTLCIETFDIPLYIDNYRFDGYKNSFPITPSICLMWWFVDFGVYGAITVFLAWGSIQRHILVFHHHKLLRTQRQKLIIHYLPMIIISIYLFGFYISVIVFPPCENTFNFQSPGCGSSPCYQDVSYLGVWDYLGNGIACTFIQTIFSIALIVRVLLQKRRINQPVNWKKHRKMALQLLSISCLFLTIVFPQSLIVVIQQVGGPHMSEFGSRVNSYLVYLYTFVVLLLPFICLGCLPELWPKLLFFKPKRRQAIGATTLIPDRGQSLAIKMQET
jgi:hypothetical protein